MGQYLIAESQSITSILGTVWVVLKTAIGLGFVIFVHELGHFLLSLLAPCFLFLLFCLKACEDVLGMQCGRAVT